MDTRNRARVKREAKLAHARLLAVLHYDPLTGVFTWRVSPSNNVVVGARAGCFCKTSGYWLISVDGTLYRAGRVAWFYVNGKWPSGLIDHRDTVKHHDWIDNLRDVTPRINSQNLRAGHADGASGLLGVSWSKLHSRWLATIYRAGKTYFIGLFDDKYEAHEAYLAKKREIHEGCTL